MMQALIGEWVAVRTVDGSVDDAGTFRPVGNHCNVRRKRCALSGEWGTVRMVNGSADDAGTYRGVGSR